MSNWFWIILQCSQLKQCHVNQSHPQFFCQGPAILKYSFQTESVLLLDFIVGKQWSVWDLLFTVLGKTFANKLLPRVWTFEWSFHCLTLIQTLPITIVNQANYYCLDAPFKLEGGQARWSKLKCSSQAKGQRPPMRLLTAFSHNLAVSTAVGCRSWSCTISKLTLDMKKEASEMYWCTQGLDILNR